MYRKTLLLILLFALPTENKKIGFNLGRGSSASRGSSSGRQYQTGSSYPQQHQQYPNSQNHGVNQPQGYPQQPSYNQGNYHPQPKQGVYHQQTNSGFNHGSYQQSNYHVNNPNTGFHQGTGPGSVSRGGQWKTALAAGAVGAVGGVLAWEAGKAIIRSATEPAHINGKEYYFNNDEHKYQKKAGELMCTMDLQDLIKQTQQVTTTTTTVSPDGGANETATTTPSPDQLLTSMQFKDGSRPKKVVWTCHVGTEVCCGTECCPAPQQQQPTLQNGSVRSVHENNISLKNVLLIVLLAILLMMCCCCFIVYTCFRTAFQSCCPLFNNNDNSVPYNYDDKYPEAQQQGYAAYHSNSVQPSNTVPMQTYPNGPVIQQQQPSQNGYPSAPGYVYPAQPYNY